MLFPPILYSLAPICIAKKSRQKAMPLGEEPLIASDGIIQWKTAVADKPRARTSCT